jgi:signal transduction histidine kinase
MGDNRSDLKAARRLGQRAMKAGVDLLGLANFHQAALDGLNSLLSSMPHASNGARKCSEFFEAVILPLEEAHLAATAANGRLEKSIKSLQRRTEDLAVTNRELRAEISRRKEVEASLRTSETTTSLLLKKSHRLQDELRLLSRRLLTVQEDERRQISRELHDVIAQTLAGINIRLAVLRSQTSANAKDFHEKIEVTERLVEKSVEIVYRFASDLRPLILDDLGFIPALQSYLRSFELRTRVSVKLTAQAVVEMLDPTARTAIFRIAQEALINISRHARASHVGIDLRPGKACVRMRIRDDGKGFDVEGHSPTRGAMHLGLLGMRERAEMVGGSLRIESKPGQGTTVWVEIPRAESVPQVAKVSTKTESIPPKISR